MGAGLPLLRIPPFPGSRAGDLAVPGSSCDDPGELAALLRQERVGGAFWLAPAALPQGTRLVLVPGNAAQLEEMIAALDGTAAVVVGEWPRAVRGELMAIPAACDPWSLAESGAELWVGAGQELAPIAALAGARLRLFGAEGPDRPETMALRQVTGWAYRNPFTGEVWSAAQAIAQLGEWRRLIAANRRIAGVHGVARWKRVTLDAMLWDGTGPVRHGGAPQPGRFLAVWKSRIAPARLAALEASGAALAEIEDGFIRSIGLGANCVPPLSAIADFSGVYFDPSAPSDLETFLIQSEISSTFCSRASALRKRLVQEAISKYGQGSNPEIQPHGTSRRILIAGQVEDDRSILSGGSGTTNLQLLERARALEPDAWLVYKPHPDVEAGHRKGHVPMAEALRFADEVAGNAPILPLIDSVDAVHVITSLAGFEALLRGKAVTTHGVPFYAGWGLTRDLGAVPDRRGRQRSLDELVAAALLLYPRYLDPVTRLPCPAEVLVERMARGQARVTSPLVTLREWQGRARALWQGLTGARR